MSEPTDCPSCGTSAWGNGWVTTLKLRSGTEVEGIICQSCGTVWVEDPKSAVPDTVFEKQNDYVGDTNE